MSRYNRWFPEGQQDWREEKEPSHMHRAAERVALRENPAFDPRVCGECLQRDCACECTDCDARGSDVVKGRCETCRDLHRMQVEREQRESIEQAAWLEAQLAMEAV